MATPSKDEVLHEIQLMLKELFDLDAEKVRPEARLIEDLELDSLDAIDLAVKVEETTGMALDDNLIRKLRTVDDVIVAVQEIVEKQGITLRKSS